MKENFLKKQVDVIEDLRSMRSELKNLLIKYRILQAKAMFVNAIFS